MQKVGAAQFVGWETKWLVQVCHKSLEVVDVAR